MIFTIFYFLLYLGILVSFIVILTYVYRSQNLSFLVFILAVIFIIGGQGLWRQIHLALPYRVPLKAIVLLAAILFLKKHLFAHHNRRPALVFITLGLIFTISQLLSSNSDIKHYVILLTYLAFTYVFTVAASLLSIRSLMSVLMCVFCLSNAIVIALSPMSLIGGNSLRLSSIFGINASAAFIAITLPFFFVLFKAWEKRIKRRNWFITQNTFFLTFITLVLLAILMFGSRQALLLFGLGILLSSILIYIPRFTYAILPPLLLIFSFSLALPPIQNKLSVLFDRYYISSVHLLNLEPIYDSSGVKRYAIFPIIQDHGMTLWGYGLFAFREKFTHPYTFENFYIEILVTFGFVGLSIVIFVFLAVFYKLITAFRNENETFQKDFLASIVISFLLTATYGFFNDLLFLSYCWVIFAAGFALAHQYVLHDFNCQDKCTSPKRELEGTIESSS